ncbi:MAG: hypothetical protein K8R46_01890 [Pirellulales bacterium]|nr:hypothetical protein [Pirellulales bacterium]
MMSFSPDQLVQLIHDSPWRIVLAATGGGSRAIVDLLEVPGGSKTLLEAVVPYSAPAMVEWLGGVPDEFCSAATARAMAMVAFQRARRYEEPESTVAGVACTASLASDRPKRGPHRIHVAVQTIGETAVWHLQLLKERRSRVEEERLAGRLLLNVVAAACDVPDRLELELLEGERVEKSGTRAPTEWQNLLLGNVESVRVGPEGEPPRLVFPGAFNPLHAGHRRMAQIARDMTQQPAAVEISIVNVDKLPLDYMEIERRLGQFLQEWTIYLTRAARFEEKSRLFAGATFIVGADTLRRIASPQYHGDDAAACRESLERIAANGCRFLVFNRCEDGGGFVRLADLDLPDVLRSICEEVPPEVFRDDVSSTALRKSGAG